MSQGKALPGGRPGPRLSLAILSSSESRFHQKDTLSHKNRNRDPGSWQGLFERLRFLLFDAVVFQPFKEFALTGHRQYVVAVSA